MSCVSVTRHHDISCGHRVVGHENKCRHLHGHNYRFHMTIKSVEGELDNVGRVIDFGVIKTGLCQWLEDNWDHKFLAWCDDVELQEVYSALGSTPDGEPANTLGESLVFLPFNPTAENMAEYLVNEIGPRVLGNCGIYLSEVTIEETTKCRATYSSGRQ